MFTESVLLAKILTQMFPTATVNITAARNVHIYRVPGDGNTTINYAFYFHPDGISIRRKIDMWCGPRYYQLNRNSRKYGTPEYWPAFQSIENAVNWFAGYIERNANKH